MTNKMGYYSVEDYLKQRRQQEKIRIPPRANFLAAVNHMRNMFEGKNFAYGVLGGFEMLCLGYRREMPDLQLAYDDRDFHRIKPKLESDPRVRLPEGINSLFPAKILVRTGPQYKDEGCTQAADVEVDLLPPGSNGTPPSGSLASNLVLVSLKTDGKLRSYKGLNMLHLVKSFVHYCRVRDLAWDPRKDLLFLCQHYGEEVQSIRDHLDPKAVQQNFLGTPFFSRLGSADQHRCYQILLGTKPPPAMALTPPASNHKHSASHSENGTRPRVISHKSSPSLNVQSSTGLLSPPLGGKRKTPTHELSELPAPVNSKPHIVSELPAPARDSRSRYRPISAPVTREGSPSELPSTTSNVRPTQPLPQAGMPAYKISAMQHTPATGMANSHFQIPGSHSNISPPGATQSQTVAHTSQPNRFSALTYPSQMHVSPIEMSATPAPSNPGQHYLKSQLGLAGDIPPAQQNARNMPITPRPVPPQARSPQHAPHANVPVELSATPAPTHQARQLHVVNPDVSAPRLNNQSPPSSAPLPPVELDAISALGQFIAELAVDSPISPPSADAETHSPTELPLGSDFKPIHIKPLAPRRQSAPLSSLPPSLMPGGAAAHAHGRVVAHVAPLAGDSGEVLRTNASRYSSYSTQTHTQTQMQGDASPSPPSHVHYQAYHPSSSSLSPPLSPPELSIPHKHSDTQQLTFSSLKDVDGANGYFRTHARNTSGDSRASSRSCDSRDLAREYRAELPDFEHGYGTSGNGK